MDDSDKKKRVGNYIFGDTIGTGSFGTVKMATHALTGEAVAVKIFKKGAEVADGEAFQKEIKSLKMLDHPSVVRLLEVIETVTRLYLVMELVVGVELFDAIVEKQSFSEPEACYIFTQLLKGIMYCHENGMVHRDLKPENILMTKSMTVKIVDFGFANMVTPQNTLLATPCGSPYYAAPEVLSGKAYAGKGVDVWSLGVILYVMVAGYLPFDDDNVATLFKYIKAGDYEIPENVSPDFIDLISRTLVVDPKKRATVADLLKHPWMTNTIKHVHAPYLAELGPRVLAEPDPELMRKMQEYGYTPAQVIQHVKANSRNAMTASYFLLQEAKAKALAGPGRDLPPDFSRSKGGAPRGLPLNMPSRDTNSPDSGGRSHRSLASSRAGTPRHEYNPRKDNYLDDEEIVIVAPRNAPLSPRSQAKLARQTAIDQAEVSRRASVGPTGPTGSPGGAAGYSGGYSGGGGGGGGGSGGGGGGAGPTGVGMGPTGVGMGVGDSYPPNGSRPGSSKPGPRAGPVGNVMQQDASYDRRGFSAPEKQDSFLPPIIKSPAQWDDMDKPSNVNQRPTPVGMANPIRRNDSPGPEDPRGSRPPSGMGQMMMPPGSSSQPASRRESTSGMATGSPTGPTGPTGERSRAPSASGGLRPLAADPRAGTKSPMGRPSP